MRALPDGILIVTFSSGESRLVDVYELDGPVFEPLRNQKILEDFDISRGYPTWLNGQKDGYEYTPPEFIEEQFI